MKQILALLSVLLLAGMTHAQNARVFETLLQSESGVDALTTEVVAQLETAGFTVLSQRASGTAAECSGAVNVVSAVQTASMDAFFDLNEQTAPYGVVERVAIFEDETGVYLSMVNPGSVLRTVFLDDSAVDALAAGRRAALKEALEATMAREYGQDRKKGHIGKTMGVMAGGPFNEKIGVIASAP